ncbi:MAG: DUF1800 family protein [Bacteroidota bacterium]
MASISLRQGVLGKRLAAHLLRRSSFKVTPARIADFASKTAQQAVDELFVVPPLTHPEGPINWVDGVTAWLTTGPYENNPQNGGQQKQAVLTWLTNEMLHDASISHKMTLFWSSIFVTEMDTDWRMFELWRLFQQFAVGNIKTLAYKVTLDNKMLRYLNNNINNKNSPNENYAREFFELFTILKGEQIDTGNYSNYTEHDIQEAARVLTGFVTSNTYVDPETGRRAGVASFGKHDAGNKKFSAAFGHQHITGATSASDMYRELQDFVDMIFGQVETARAFVRRMYRFFVSDFLTEEIENDVIEPLAQQLFSDGYEVENTLKTLLRSVHFYDEDDSDNHDEIIGGKIKSPLELYLSGINLFDANQMGVLNDDPAENYSKGSWLISYNLVPLGFSYYPSSVEGYPGFFKAPNYSKSWFDQATISSRYRLSYSFLQGRTVKNNKTIPFAINTVNYFNTHFSNQSYSDELVTQLLEIALPEMPDTDRFEYFRQKLLGQLSPINWAFEWANYESTGDGAAIEIALNDLFAAVCDSPEFQTF